METKLSMFSFLLIAVLSSLITLVGTASNAVHLSGPKLTSYPGPLSYFSNSVGLTLSCSAKDPSSVISWFSADSNEPISKVPGLREQLDNGSLYFFPFSPDEYLPAIHNAQYRCSAQNSVGTELSPLIRVEAVIDPNFEVAIKSSNQQDWLEGNPALLECQVNPPYHNQFTRIIAWKEIDQFGHEREISNSPNYPTTQAHHGHLLILSAPLQRLFVCVVQNTLNNKQIKSSAPFLFKSIRAPPALPPQPLNGDRLANRIIISRGKSEDMFCIVGGNPRPMIRWDKIENGKWMPVNAGVGPFLRLNSQPEDIKNNYHINGTYRCEASNAYGTTTIEYFVDILDKPLVTMTPQRIEAYAGQAAEFSCSGGSSRIPSESGDFVYAN